MSSPAKRFGPSHSHVTKQVEIAVFLLSYNVQWKTINRCLLFHCKFCNNISIRCQNHLTATFNMWLHAYLTSKLYEKTSEGLVWKWNILHLKKIFWVFSHLKKYTVSTWPLYCVVRLFFSITPACSYNNIDFF